MEQFERCELFWVVLVWLWVWFSGCWRALAKGTAWAGFYCVIHHHHGYGEWRSLLFVVWAKSSRYQN